MLKGTFLYLLSDIRVLLQDGTLLIIVHNIDLLSLLQDTTLVTKR